MQETAMVFQPRQAQEAPLVASVRKSIGPNEVPEFCGYFEM